MKSKSFFVIILKAYFGMILFLGVSAEAAVSPRAKQGQMPVHKNILRGEGALHGGKSGDGFSILDIERSALGKRSERLMIGIGDIRLQKITGSIGYYNVEMKKDNRLIITFSQTLNAKLENKDLKQKFAKSIYVKNSQFQFDPIGQNMTLELELKKPVVLRVVSLKGGQQTGRLVLDMIEDRQR